MFKSTSERASFKERVASHSTKGFANGRVDVLPPQARELEVVYSGLVEQYKVADQQVALAEKELKRVDDALRLTMPRPLYEKFISERVALIRKVSVLRTELGTLRNVVRAAGEKAYTECFYYLAERRLAKELFRSVDEEVMCIMGRPRHELIESQKSKARRSRKQKKEFYKEGAGL